MSDENDGSNGPQIGGVDDEYNDAPDTGVLDHVAAVRPEGDGVRDDGEEEEDDNEFDFDVDESSDEQDNGFWPSDDDDYVEDSDDASINREDEQDERAIGNQPRRESITVDLANVATMSIPTINPTTISGRRDTRVLALDLHINSMQPTRRDGREQQGMEERAVREGGEGGARDGGGNDVADNDGDDVRTALLFRRFVTMLGDEDGRLHREMGRIYMHGFMFDDVESYPQQDLETLFGEVFRSLPGLTNLMFVNCTLPAASCLDALARSPPPRLRSLNLTDCTLDAGAAAHIAALVGRPESHIEYLIVSPLHGGLESDDCRVLCECIPRNPSLRFVILEVKAVGADTLRGAAGAASSLRHLYITGSFSEEGIASVAHQLRTNTRIVSLTLQGPGVKVVPEFLELVDTYNITLRSVTFGHSSALVPSMRRSRRIRTIVRRILRPCQYRIAPPTRWPRVYGSVSAFPTLLYRLLRHGDVDFLCDVVRAAARGESWTADGRPPALKRPAGKTMNSPSPDA